jgi:ubiquinone/menaquinone biosynthesis C-methylase UbiE
MSSQAPDDIRAQLRDRWQRGAAGWGRRADAIQEFGMPVSVWMIEQLDLQPGQHVVELACGPGDTGFLAAEQVRPGGLVTETDASDAMLGVAKGRARDLGASNVEFKRMELEWLDLPAASVDAILCRWGLMFAVDQQAAAREMRRVLRPGGRLALAVWDRPELNPWATAPTQALVELGHAEPPAPTLPGMFVLADAGRLQELLESAGLTEVVVQSLELVRRERGVEDFIKGTVDMSVPFAEVRDRLTPEQWREVEARIGELVAPYIEADDKLVFPARALVAAASA